MKMVAIVVPAYREKLLETELISLNQLLKVLDSYDIFFVCDKKLDAEYIKGKKAIHFPSKFFESIEGYNNLMLSMEFYESFSEYQYILVYQLDAFVFSDKLGYFCNLNYDYIGAPWLASQCVEIENKKKSIYVGNGGLSLRNVTSCKKLLNDCKQLPSFIYNEDIFFALGDCETFHVAPIDVALKFAFEKNVRECYKRNNFEIPFGCHAWFKYDLAFWRPAIEEWGYDIDFLLDGDNLDKSHNFEQERKINKFWTNDKISDGGLLEERNVYIWGCGEYGMQTLRILNNSETKVSGFIDNDIDKIGKNIDSYDIFSPSIISNKDASRIVIIAMVDGKEVEKQMVRQGGKYLIDYIYYYDIMN